MARDEVYRQTCTDFNELMSGRKYSIGEKFTSAKIDFTVLEYSGEVAAGEIDILADTVGNLLNLNSVSLELTPAEPIVELVIDVSICKNDAGELLPLFVHMNDNSDYIDNFSDLRMLEDASVKVGHTSMDEIDWHRLTFSGDIRKFAIGGNLLIRKLCYLVDVSKSKLCLLPSHEASEFQHIIKYRHFFSHAQIGSDEIECDFHLVKDDERLKFACVPILDGGIDIHIVADLRFDQYWKFETATIGDLASTISLAPAEQLSLQISTSQRKYFEQSTLDTVENLETSESTLVDKDVMNVTRASAKEQNWKVDGSASVNIGDAVGLNFGGGAGGSASQSAQTAIEQISEATSKSAHSLKAMRKTEIKETKETTEEVSNARKIHNPYRDRSLLLNVWEINKRYSVTTTLSDICPSLLIDVKSLLFDSQFV